MNILIQGYFDRNFGDDMMIRIASYNLANHKLFIDVKRNEVFEPFSDLDNVFLISKCSDVNIDLILRVTGSGFFISSRRGLMEYFYNQIKYKNKYKHIPKGVIGCNIGPFLNSIAKFLILREVNKFQLVTVRESFSMQYIKKIKTKGCYPDILFSMPDEWITPNTGEGCLGISAYRLKNKSNLQFYTNMAKVADDYVEKTGKKVILFAFDIENENDLCGAYTIKSLCRHKENIEIIAHDDNGNNIIKNFARCSCIVGVRFHSCILAMRMNIRFVPLMYSNKLYNVLKDMGYKDKCFDIRNFNSEEIINEIYENKVFHIPDDVIAKSEEHFNIFKNTMLNI